MKVVVTLPTYNERLNIDSLLDALLAVDGNIEVLVIDDDSPDGTWQRVAERAQSERRVHLLHRRGARGRGTAGVAGFVKALEMKADLIVEMDADWSHHPRHLAHMLQTANEADVVIGSRLIRGGGETGRNAMRTVITHAANLYLRIMLGLPVRDCTSGYRVFRRWVLDGIDWNRIQATGPSIVQEVLVAAHALRARFTEVPILFEERRAGRSTFNSKILLAGLAAPWRLRLRPAPVRPT